MSHQPALGIKDPYELNEDQYKAALDLLRQQRQLVGRYWHDAFVQIDDFKNEGVVASGSWPFQANTLIADKQPIATTVPKEGVTGWADTSMVHSEAKNLTCAYQWLEHSLNNKLQGDLASWFGSVPVVPAACEGNALLGKEGARPTASTTSIGFTSGVPLSPSARAREPACPTTAGSRTISPSCGR
jgi:putative spermidine/putrescine transport system substrate-binding protein